MDALCEVRGAIGRLSANELHRVAVFLAGEMAAAETRASSYAELPPPGEELTAVLLCEALSAFASSTEKELNDGQ